MKKKMLTSFNNLINKNIHELSEKLKVIETMVHGECDLVFLELLPYTQELELTLLVNNKPYMLTMGSDNFIVEVVRDFNFTNPDKEVLQHDSSAYGFKFKDSFYKLFYPDLLKRIKRMNRVGKHLVLDENFLISNNKYYYYQNFNNLQTIVDVRVGKSYNALRLQAYLQYYAGDKIINDNNMETDHYEKFIKVDGRQSFDIDQHLAMKW